MDVQHALHPDAERIDTVGRPAHGHAGFEVALGELEAEGVFY